MLPTEKTKPKESLQDFTLLIYGSNKIGKCVRGNTVIYQPVRGHKQTMSSLVNAQKGEVHTLKTGGIISSVTPSHFIKNEPAQLYSLKTQTGRIIETTEKHPFLTGHY